MQRGKEKIRELTQFDLIAYIYQMTRSSVFFTLKKWTELAKLDCSRLKQTKLDQHGLKWTEVYQMDLIGPKWNKWIELDQIGPKWI